MFRNEWHEAREEKAADYRRFSQNEAALEDEAFRRAQGEEARKARLAKAVADGVFGK